METKTERSSLDKSIFLAGQKHKLAICVCPLFQIVYICMPNTEQPSDYKPQR